MSLVARAANLLLLAGIAGGLVRGSWAVARSAAADAGVEPMKVAVLPLMLSALLVGVGLRAFPSRRRRFVPLVVAVAGATVGLAWSDLDLSRVLISIGVFVVGATGASLGGRPGPPAPRALRPAPPMLPDDAP